ncbi:vomeronasal type-1 receptor 4-like [Phodopus roborovskii]|uniref:vomeronasal type-1 receptor 4-like n=1 Tax=Phodopus roborovskii TaxID=109678 RepID=UPI0021E4EA1A|nr:vomeronasal type-1 receptor 4-like [Phodopus roborovskii]
MSPTELALGIFFMTQTALGMLGNSALLCCFIVGEFSRIRPRPTDLIVKHLTGANFLVLLCKGIPQTMAAFGQTQFLDNSACKLLFYFHRVVRGVSLGSTSLLTFFQAIMVTPRNVKNIYFKSRAPNIIGPSVSLCWFCQLMVNGFIPVFIIDMHNGRNCTGIRDFLYCAVAKSQNVKPNIYAILLSSFDVMFLGIMIWASGSMVLFLLKHKQRVQNIHRVHCLMSSPEIRATQTILVMVSSFVFFYTTSGILTLCLTFVNGPTRWLVNASVATAACFPALCPFLLIRHYTSVSCL